MLLCLSPRIAMAQSVIGARGMALGGATTALNGYEWSIFSNPATLSSSQLNVGFYGLRNYGISELSDLSASAIVPTRAGLLAAGMHRYGGDLFSETSYRAAYKNTWQNVHFGLVVNYNHIAISGGYGSGGALALNLGIAAQIFEGFMIGAKSTNVNGAAFKFQGYDETLYRDLSLGMSYLLAEKATIVVDMVKDIRFPLAWRTGIEVEIVPTLTGRIGVTTEPITYSFGLGYSSSTWLVNLVVQQHEILGSSPGFDIQLKL